MTNAQFEIPNLIASHAPALALRSYQRECVDAVKTYLAEHPHGRPAVQLPTGGGKTVVFASVAKEHGYPVLVLAHRDELLDQAADKFRMVDPGVTVGKVKAEHNQPWAEVIVASVQTLARPARLAAMPPNGHFRLIVIDEAHHAPADSYRQVLRHYHGTPVLGVSATLERGDGSGLDGVFDDLVYEKDILWMIGQGYLCDITPYQIELADFNFARVKMGMGRKDFADGSLGQALHDAGAAGYALKAFQKHGEGRRAIAFTPTVGLAEEFAEVFNDGGIPAACVSGETPRTERQRIYKGLRDGSIRVVANAMVLTEGFDEPAVDCIIVSRPTLSRSLFIQMIGRGLRLHPGKDDCVVLDMVGNTDRVRLVTVPNLFGVPSSFKPKQGATITQTIAAVQAQPAMPRDDIVLRDIESIAVDLFTQRKFHWLTTKRRDGSHAHVLSVGDGMVVLRRNDVDDAELYDVVHEKRGGAETIAVGLSLEYATGAAEDHARRLGADVFASKEASWRRKPATEKQLAALAKWGVAPDGPLTSGEASDLLSQAIASRKKAA